MMKRGFFCQRKLKFGSEIVAKIEDAEEEKSGKMKVIGLNREGMIEAMEIIIG